MPCMSSMGQRSRMPITTTIFVQTPQSNTLQHLLGCWDIRT